MNPPSKENAPELGDHGQYLVAVIQANRPRDLATQLAECCRKASFQQSTRRGAEAKLETGYQPVPEWNQFDHV